MICPNCKKPYFFMDSKDNALSHCLKCSFRKQFTQPTYDAYHENLYEKKTYVRTIKSDPQMRFILKKLSLKTSSKIIDIGCGIGDYASAISLINKKVTGLDRNVSSAKNKYPDVSFQDHDCNNALPYPNNSIDTIVSINLIEHLTNYQEFLSECKRVLRPGGKIALTTANLDFILHDYFFDKTHVHEWTFSQFKELIEKYFNIEIIEKSSSMFNYYPLNFITTKFLKPDLLFIGIKKII